ncbi:MAG: methyltransferase domain-containing protein [Caldilineaceae bacterium]
MSTVLDSGQYTKSAIEKYEAVYGRNFVSPGGLGATQAFTALLKLQADMTVLDVGCGIGGGAFYMAKQYGVQVHGLDLSTNMLALAEERCKAAHLEKLVTFTQGDILTFAPSIQYDRVYSRDVFLHIDAKAQLFRVLNACLKPGGILLFTDYCCGENEKSAEFADYIRQRNYALCTVAEYQAWLAETGFGVLAAEDRTAQFIRILEQEVTNLPVDRLDPHLVDDIKQAWQEKIVWARRGEQRWGLFMAQRK